MKNICPKCRNEELKYYHGMLGYESVVCPKCGLDYNDEKMIPYLYTWIEELMKG